MRRINFVKSLFCSALMVWIPGGAALAADALTATGRTNPASVAPGAKTSLQITLVVNPPFHVYSNPPSQSFLIPVTVAVQTPANVTAGQPVYPAGTSKKFAFADQPIRIYQGSVVVKVPLSIGAKAAAGKVTIAGTVHYQACNETNCFAPTSAKFSADLTIGTGAAQVSAHTAATGSVAASGAMPQKTLVAIPRATVFAGGNSVTKVSAVAGNASTNSISPPQVAAAPASRPAAGVSDTSPSPAVGGPAGMVAPVASAGQTTSGDAGSWLGHTTDALAQSIRGAPVWLSLVFIFIGGLLMNLTPCVYPMVPITIGYFGSQAEGGRAASFKLSFLYVLGLAAVYSTLGVLAGLTGSLFGSMLQSPFIVGGIAVIFFVLSLSMLGLFTLQPPQFLMSKSGAKQGALGAFAMGALLGVVAVPCIGPVVAVLVGIVAQEHSWLLGLLRFFVLSLGLGLPYLLLGAFTGAAKSLPRSGAWLERSKKIFAIPIMLVAFFYGGQAWATYSAPKVTADARELRLKYNVVGLPDIVFLDGAGQERKDLRCGENLTKAEFIQKLDAVKNGESSGQSSEFEAVNAAALEEARRVHKPVVLDFRANWCVPCRKLEADVFSQADVEKAAAGVTLLRVDLTNDN